MKLSILKPIVLGVLFGALAFMMPFFLLRVVFIVLIIGFIFRLFRGGWGGWHHRGGYGYYATAHADRIRSMSDEEYAAYKTKYQSCYGPYERETKTETK
jgi:hypothetical protein